MGRRLGIPLLVAVLLLAAAAAQGEIFQAGTLRVDFKGDFAPHALPRDRSAPVTVTVEGRIGTTDGSHPPPLKQLEIGLNRNGKLTTMGLPACRAATLQSTTSAAALKLCRPALVGSGTFRADLELSQEGLPARGRILIFNSLLQGRPGLLLHIYGTVPVQATFVLPLVISHRPGEFGTVISTKVPRLAAGLGSITQIKLRIGRTYRFRGERLSYLSARCAAPQGFSLAVFPFARGTFTFADGRHLRIGITRDCRVR
jgi:hypothetical protein